MVVIRLGSSVLAELTHLMQIEKWVEWFKLSLLVPSDWLSPQSGDYIYSIHVVNDYFPQVLQTLGTEPTGSRSAAQVQVPDFNMQATCNKLYPIAYCMVQRNC